VTDAVAAAASRQSGLQRLSTTFRAGVQEYEVSIDRTKAAALQVSVQDVFNAISSSVGSSFVEQFDRFGRTFQVFIQADGANRIDPEQITQLRVRNANGDMVPLGTLVTLKPANGASLVSLYNLYPSATITGVPAPGFSSGEAIDLMEQTAAHILPPGTGYEWTAMSYQEKMVSGQLYFVFGLSLLLVYFVIAAQYESWWLPLSVILAVPLALAGPVATLTMLGVNNNLYTQIGLILLIALSAKNAILIVEVARELRRKGESILESAAQGAVARLQPILMTSIAFSLGVVPLVLASGAGANARRSIGITTLTGMISSTCLTVVLVPSFFVILQHVVERRRKSATIASLPAPPLGQEREAPLRIN
jgi:HAE1 family hydrophobic/amphiphilic exporter-1